MASLAEKIDDYLVRYLAYFNYKDYVNQILLNGHEKVLEVGCGGGNLSRFLANKLHRGKLFCVDSSNYWINKARKRLEKFENIQFVKKDILDFENKNYFDIVIVHYVLHDLIQKEKFIEVLKNTLKQEGKMYVKEPTRISHGIAFEEIEDLINQKEFLKEKSEEGYSFPLKGKVYEGFFRKK